MGDSADFFSTICRVCLSSNSVNNVVPLLDNSSKDGLSSFGRATMAFTDISITDNSLPKFMCEDCLQLLKSAITLKKKCESSNRTLENLVATCNNESKVKEVICEYVMFKKYLPEELEATCNQKSVERRRMKIEDEVCNLNTKEVFDNEFDSESNMDNTSNNQDDTQSSDHLKLGEESTNEVDVLLNKMESICQMDYQTQNILRRKCYAQMKLERKNNTPKTTIGLDINKSIKLFQKKSLQVPNIESCTKNKRDILCKVCNKVLANTFTYKNHMQKHNTFKFICEICAKGFAEYSALQGHQACIHGIGRFYKCQQCDYKGPRRNDLVIHERTHSGERPYSCDKCGLTFRRRHCWKMHAVHHRDKSIQCPKCPKKFHHKEDMLAHYNSLHERMRVYQCPKCSITYAKTTTVRRHLIEKHGIAREDQGKIPRLCLKKRSAIIADIQDTVKP